MLVDVVLACFNGEKFILDFLKSLDEQTHQEWRLIIRDDDSIDLTLSLIKGWSNGKSVVFVDDNLGRLNVVQNFSECLKYSTAEYVLLADQDDVWEPNKIEVLLKEIIFRENLNVNESILVFSDLFVVDEKLNIIDSSFSRKVGADEASSLEMRKLLVQNVAPGCSMIFNKKLLIMALPIPKEAILHDWWLILIAKAAGRVFFLDIPLIKYRQHSGNQVGSGLKIKNLLKKVFNTISIIKKLQNQANKILEKKIYPENKILIINFVRILNLNFFNRKKEIIYNGFLKKEGIKNIIFIFFI